jgi:hypothetical protein
MWLAHALENLPIYLCTHQKQKQQILYIQKLFNKHNLNEITSFTKLNLRRSKARRVQLVHHKLS